MGEGECESIEPTKKARHRKKHLYATILKQMEFYFSDSNLSKDRFLSQLISKDPYIDLKVFLSFNKMRKLNCSLEDIQKAISNSELIELSEDKEKVRRKKPLVINENTEACTIYVENIKADVDHEWLTNFFSDFGKVVYVSIPKYKHTKGNKGFAFVEFEHESEAANALNYFESIGCKMPSHTNPEDLYSIKTFLAENKISDNLENNKDISKDDNKQDNIKKRKHSIDEENSEKRYKVESECDLKETDEAAEVQNEDAESKKKKKHKKDKKKNYIKDLGIKILSKKEWKKLRNRYLDLQRKKMKEFKHYLHKQKNNTTSDNEKNTKETHMETDESGQKEKIDFVPGVIVKVKLLKPYIDAKKLKNEIKALSPEIKYVDVPLPAGSEEVYVRFASSESAKQFSEQESVGPKTILDGEEEKEYWEKIHNDRTVKFSRNIKKQRGRDKLLKKAEKLRAQHIRFDEGE